MRALATAAPVPLRILLAVALVLSLAWIAFSPTDQGPDESQHFAYVQHLAETGHRPGFVSGGQPLSTEQATAINTFGLLPLLGNAAARPTAGPVTRGEWRRASATFTKAQRSDGNGPNGQAQNPILYYALDAIPYRVSVALGAGYFGQVASARLANVLFFLVGLVFVWLLAAEVFSGQFMPTVATSVVAVNPKLTSLVGNVSTESLLFLCFTAAMYAAVRAIRHGPTLRNVALLTVAAVAAAMTQGRGLAVTPAAILALVLAITRARPGWRRTLALTGLMGAILIAGAAILAMTSGGLGGGSTSAFGGAATTTAKGFNIGDFLSTTWQFYFPKLGFMSPRLGLAYGYRQVDIETFFSSLFSYEVVFRQTTFDLIQTAAGIGLAWLGVALIVRRRAVRASWQVVVALAAFLFAELALLHLNSYQQMLNNGGADPIITGRYLVALIALMGLAIAFCVGSLPRRSGALAAGVIVAFLVALQISSLGISIARFYA